jgi:hypothetical protein
MSEEKKPFDVKDRRHFTVDGEARDASQEPPPPPEEEPVSPRPEPPQEEPFAERSEHPPSSAAGLDFTGLLLSLGAQASLLLAGMSSADASGEPEARPDLAGARAIISLLEVLREKTEGRRTREEDDVLGGILYELRMAYVNSARRGGS